MDFFPQGNFTVDSASSPAQKNKTLSQNSLNVLQRFLSAERQHTPILLASLAVGILSGIVGGLFHRGMDAALYWRGEWLNEIRPWGFWGLLLAIGLSALLLSSALFLVRRFAPETSGSGVQEIEGVLDGVKDLRWKRVLPVKFFGGLLALASGLVLGREGPTIQMGGALGKMWGERSRLPREHILTLVAAGAGAGLSAAFNAPLAGILFVIEEMRPQFRYNFLSVQAVLMACAASDAMVRALTSQAPVIPIAVFPDSPLSSLWSFILLGACFGFFGWIFNHGLIRTLDLFSALPMGLRNSAGLWLGGALGALTWWAPALTGGGEIVLGQAMSGKFVLSVLLFLFGARFLTTWLSYGSGAPGGIFAPMLALGTLFGISFGEIFQSWFPAWLPAPGVFAVAGMGALFSATVRAPLTGIALAMEMTGNYSQILPLILTCMSATVVAEWLGVRPIYTVLLQRSLTKVPLTERGEARFRQDA